MKKLNKVALVTAKIIEVIHWLGVLSMVLLFAASFFAKDMLTALPLFGVQELNSYGFQAEFVGGATAADLGVVRLLSVSMIFTLTMMAMVYRNIYLIFKKTLGEQTFQPFQPDVVRMVREIGIFNIAVPVIGLAASIAGRLCLGASGPEFSVGLSGIVTGIVILCLSQVFAYGAALQNDVEGLL